jgi:hypothetical protein
VSCVTLDGRGAGYASGRRRSSRSDRAGSSRVTIPSSLSDVTPHGHRARVGGGMREVATVEYASVVAQASPRLSSECGLPCDLLRAPVLTVRTRSVGNERGRTTRSFRSCRALGSAACSLLLDLVYPDTLMIIECQNGTIGVPRFAGASTPCSVIASRDPRGSTARCRTSRVHRAGLSTAPTTVVPRAW